MLVSVDGVLTKLINQRPAPKRYGELNQTDRPVNKIDAVIIDTAEGEIKVAGPLLTYPACDPYCRVGQHGRFDFFLPQNKGSFSDGPRPLEALISVTTPDKTVSDRSAIIAASNRIEKILAMEISNKAVLGLMVIALLFVGYDIISVIWGDHETVNPELGIWGLIAPALLIRSYWFRRKKRKLHQAMTVI